MMAIWRRGKPQGVLHHSDRGSQYTSEQCQRLLGDMGVTFSSLRTERMARKTYRTRNEAKADVFDYIERFYNPLRRENRSVAINLIRDPAGFIESRGGQTSRRTLMK